MICLSNDSKISPILPIFTEKVQNLARGVWKEKYISKTTSRAPMIDLRFSEIWFWSVHPTLQRSSDNIAPQKRTGGETVQSSITRPRIVEFDKNLIDILYGCFIVPLRLKVAKLWKSASGQIQDGGRPLNFQY